MNCLLRAFAFLVLFWSGVSAAQEPPEPVASSWSAIEDPRRLEDLAQDALASGKRDDARAVFTAMLEREEVSSYLPYRPSLKEALVLERLGESDKAAVLYREAFDNDVLRVIQVLRIMSVHPDRDVLVAEAYDHVRALVAKAKSGEDARIYTTSKGAARNLKVMTTQEVMELAAAGKKAKYCYVEDFDLTEWTSEELPEHINFVRCVIGRIHAPSLDFTKFTFKGIVLGQTDFGKFWHGERNKTKNKPASTFQDLFMREAVFVGPANFAGIEVENAGRAYFPMVVFESEADFKGAEFTGVSEFRFASFGAGANFKHLRMHDPVYFGGTRYRSDTVFTHMSSERTIYFNTAEFEGKVTFDHCDWGEDAIFENARFEDEADFETTEIEGLFNLSRAVFEHTVNIKDVTTGEIAALGTHFQSKTWFTDTIVGGRARFSIDEVTRRSVRGSIDELLPLYRHYQGDEDADEPLTEKTSYGVISLLDLQAQFDGDLSFANTEFHGYTVFEGVVFGRENEQTRASFFNSQFLGETHFERTQWFAQADFTTIFGPEIAFNQATFHRSLILDDANINGRLTLSDAEFVGDADLSFYAAEIRTFEIDDSQVDAEDEPHRLFYERCADGRIDRDDIRTARMESFGQLTDREMRLECYDNLNDELVALKETYGDRAMIEAEDNIYWWMRHHQAREHLTFGTPMQKFVAVTVEIVLFEWAFGWGVNLGNLGVAVLLISWLFAVLYRVFCPNSVMIYDGKDVPVRDISFAGLMYISLQSLMAFNTGWDFGEDDHRMRYLNTLETLIGFIILTFFVGAYTRQILS